MIHPIKDEYWTDNSDDRSSTFAQTKGQTVTNSKKQVINATNGAATPQEQ
jgi:hypothetical protein